MVIKSVRFAGAIAKPGGRAPGSGPQIAFSGRSNVGKSSLINRLLGRTRSHVARVSAMPGKTQEINFYDVRVGLDGRDVRFYLVDLPGYGYARVSKEQRRRWKPLIERYLAETEELVGVVQLVDARHGPTAADLQMIDFLAGIGVPSLFVLTKADKLSRREREVEIPGMAKRLGVDEDQIVLFSARSGEGRDELLEALAGLVDEHRSDA
ncbi:MAG TPA: ribosome biogenesis GTP-binding protein YihA/YsxC [Longimicrobiales bacterium]